MNNLNTKDKGRNVFKIIVPLTILIIIGCIWFIKNGQTKAIAKNDAIAVEEDDTDFALHVEETLDLEQLKTYKLPIVIDFGADSCMPCKQMAPVLKELNEDLRGKAIVKFVDVWKDQELAKEFPVQVIPTQFFFDKEGKPYVPKNPEGMEMQMYSSKDTNEHAYTAHQGGMTKEQILQVLKEMGLSD